MAMLSPVRVPGEMRGLGQMTKRDKIVRGYKLVEREYFCKFGMAEEFGLEK